MRILLTGNVHPSSPEQIYFYELSKFDDLSVEFVPTGKWFDQLGNTFIKKIVKKVFYNFLINKLQEKLLKEVLKFKPDVIMVFKGMEIQFKTLQLFKSKNIKLVNFNGDHPYKFVSKGSGNDNTIQSIKLYDLYLTYSPVILKDLLQKNYLQSDTLTYGFDTRVVDCLLDESEIIKCCFVGNPDDKRAQIIKTLANSGIAIDVYGTNWNTHIQNDAYIKIFDALKGINYWNTLKRYRVQINILREHNLGSHNMRTFEVCGVGGVLLSEYSIEQANLYTENKEVFFYSNMESLINMANQILKMPTDAINEIRKNASDKTINNYSYEKLSQLLVRKIKNIK